MLNLLKICLCLYISLTFCISCKNNTSEISIGSDQTAVNKEVFLNNNLLPDNVGFIIYDLEKRCVIKSYNRKKGFIPASTTKIPTVVAALDILGSEYRFKTILGYSGHIENNILKGDLYLKGTGDPLLSATHLMLMVEKLKELGIKKIGGNIYYDESELFNIDIIDKKMDIDVPYNSGLSALSLDFNSVHAIWKPDKKSKSADIFLVPSLLNNKIKILSKDKNCDQDITFSFQKKDNNEIWELSTDINKMGRERLPVKNAGLYTAHMFSKICSLYGISIGNIKSGQMPNNYKTVYVHQSRPLLEIVDLTLTYSNNLMAELILLTMAKKISGKSVSLEESGIILSKYFSSKMPKIDWKDFYIKNGSGLSSENRISPEQMLGILLYADLQVYDNKSFISLLPISGWKWSMMTRLNNPDTAFHVWAKTGGINYAIALAGYFFTKSNKKMLFAFFISDEVKRAAYESDPDKKNKKSMKKVYSWINCNRNGMDNIITQWIQEL